MEEVYAYDVDNLKDAARIKKSAGLQGFQSSCYSEYLLETLFPGFSANDSKQGVELSTENLDQRLWADGSDWDLARITKFTLS